MSKLNLFAIVTALGTFILLVAGALVTSTGSGLAVPDWPLSYGQFFPRMKGGVFFEHGHRMVAGMVGILTAVLAAALWVSENRRWVRWLGTAALGAALLEALLGGITVLYGLPPAVSVAHAVLAQTFFCLTVSIALFTSGYWQNYEEKSVVQPGKIRFYLAALATALVYVQLIVGAALRHGGGILFLWLHGMGAVLATLALAGLCFVSLKDAGAVREIRILAQALAGIIVFQLLLGGIILLPFLGIALYLPGIFRTATVTVHVASGALLLAGSLLMTLISCRI